MQEQLSENPVRPARRRREPIQTHARPSWIVAMVVAAVLLLSLIGLGFLTASGRLGPIVSATTGVLRGRSDPTPAEYFNAGLENWISATIHSTGTPLRLGAGDWICSTNGAEPGALRIWKESLDIANYDIAFHGRINVRAMGWAFRAVDAGTLYGMKITVASPGHGSISHLEHFIHIGGREVARESTLLPVLIEEGSECFVQVRVRGSRFVTYIDGQMADMWSDTRLTDGGIGFFSDPGESSTIRFVKLTERQSLVGRLAGLFSLIVRFQ